MRTLKFTVDAQKLEKDPSCDFSGLVAGTSGYLKAEFEFSKEWDNCIKVAEFTSGTQEYPPKVISELNSCIIPAQILKRSVFKIRILGQKGDLKLRTNTVTIKQEGGGR